MLLIENRHAPGWVVLAVLVFVPAAVAVSLFALGMPPFSPARPDAPPTYEAQLQSAWPQGWIEQFFRGQRRYGTLVQSHELAAKGLQDDAAAALQRYLAADPDDLVVQFEYLVLASALKEQNAAVAAADRILAAVPGFAPARLYRGLAKAKLGDSRGALSDLAAAAGSTGLSADDTAYARRSLALVAVKDPNAQEALAILDREAAKEDADTAILVAQGQVLQHLGRAGDAIAAFDKAGGSPGAADQRRTAYLFGADLALKSGDAAGALSRAQAGWALTPGNPDAAALMADAAARLGKADLVLSIERETKAAGKDDRNLREVFANALFQAHRYEAAADRFHDLALTAKSTQEAYRLHRAAGFAAQAAKEPARAFSELQQAADIAPEPEALSAAAEAASQARRFDVAAADLRRLAAASEGAARSAALKRLSVAQEQAGKFREALAALDEIPAGLRDADTERRSAILATKAGDLAAAVGYDSRLAKAEPTRANLRHLGEAQLAVGQTTAAVKSFEQAVRTAGAEDPALRETLANALVTAGQPARAAESFDALAKTASPADEYRLRLAAGFAALKAGEAPQALAMFRRAVQLRSTPEALEAVAVAALKAGLSAEAVEYRSRLVRLQPTGKNLRGLGEMQLAAGDPAAALQSFRNALKVEAKDDGSLHEALANALLAAGRPAAAATEFEGLAAKAGEPAAEYRLRMAAGFARLKGDDPGRALALFRRAVQLQPTREALEAAVETSLRAKQPAEAAGYLERLAAAANPTAAAPYLERLSVVYEDIGRPVDAMKALDRLPAAKRTQPPILRRQALLAQKSGNRKLAAAYLRTLTAIAPTPDNVLALADALIAAGNRNAAAAELRSRLGDPNLTTATKAQYAERLGNLAAAAGNAREAATLFSEAFRLSPSHPSKLLAQAAEASTAARDWHRAAEDYRILVADNRVPARSRGAYAVQLTGALMALKQDNDALAASDEALRLGASSAQLHANRGELLVRLHRPAAAASEYRAAYDAQPRPDFALSAAYAHQAARQPGLAIVFLRRALTQSPRLSADQRLQADAAIGYAYMETKQYGQASQHFERALAELPRE